MERYELKPPVPVRALAIGAALTIAGALVVVLTSALSWPAVVLAPGILFIIVGLALVIFGAITPSRLAVVVTTDSDGYRISAGRQSAGGQWDEVVRAVQSDTGSRITLERRDGSEHHILAPGRVSIRTVDALANDIRGRLQSR